DNRSYRHPTVAPTDDATPDTGPGGNYLDDLDAEAGGMTDWQWFIIDALQAFAAGLLVGGTYGLMCVGLGIIFGVMRVVNFAQGDFMMLGMYVAYYLVTGFGVLAFLGPYAAPIVGAALAGPVVFVIGTLLHRTLIARVTGARVVSAEAEGHYAQIILTLG